MGEGINRSIISNYLYLTPPAVSHRIRKYEWIWPNIFKRKYNARVLTEEGFEVCKKAKSAVYSLLGLKPTDSYKELVEKETKNTFGKFGKQISKKPYRNT
jgi:hypothetical protein